MRGEHHKVCLLLAGGTGARIDHRIPKQYLLVEGVTVLEYTLRRLLYWEGMDGLLVAAERSWHGQITDILDRCMKDSGIPFLGFTEPGSTRQHSIWNALQALYEHMAADGVIMIHDAVRPMVSADLIRRCDKRLEEADGVMPYLAMKDTVYISREGKVVEENIKRSFLIRGQTPEFYRFFPYYNANASLSLGELQRISGSTEPAVRAHMQILLEPGEEENFKLTTPPDLERFERIIKTEGQAREGQASEGQTKEGQGETV